MTQPWPGPTSSARSAGANAGYFPPRIGDEWEALAPESLGWKHEPLQQLLRFLEERNSTGFVLLHGGRIAVESYWRGTTALMTADVASAQKSLTAILIGIAQTEGLLRINDPVSSYIAPGWSRAPAEAECRISLRHLLTMTSGLTGSLEYAVEPGRVWAYNTPAYHVLKAVLEAVSGKDLNIYTREKVWDPIGDRDSAWQPRAVGPFTAWAASARDMARFGLMVLRAGSWDGQEIVLDKQYLAEAPSPSQDLNPRMGTCGG